MKRARHCGISSVKATKDGIFSSSPTQIRRRKSWHGRNEGDTAPSAKSNEKGRFGINTEPPFSCSNQHAEKVCKCAQLHRAKGLRQRPHGHPQSTRGRSMSVRSTQSRNGCREGRRPFAGAGQRPAGVQRQRLWWGLGAKPLGSPFTPKSSQSPLFPRPSAAHASAASPRFEESAQGGLRR